MFAGKNFCIGQISDLCANPVALESTQLIQHILMFLSRSEGLSKHVDSFMQMLSLVQLKDGSQFILAPFLPDELRANNIFRYVPSTVFDNFFSHILWTKLISGS